MIRNAIAAMVGRSGVAAPSDPYWANVVLLVGNDNAGNGTTTFADQSGSAHSMTRAGSAVYSTAQAPTGMTSSLSMPASGDYIYAADSADWDLGSGDFTIEGMVRVDTSTTATIYHTLVSQWEGPGSAGSDSFWVLLPKASTGTNDIYFEWNGPNAVGRASTPTTDTWYHYAVTREGNTMRYWRDGVQQGADISFANTITNSTTTLRVGQSGYASTYNLIGYTSNVRITKGVARYSAGFTPPTLPMPTQ